MSFISVPIINTYSSSPNGYAMLKQSAVVCVSQSPNNANWTHLELLGPDKKTVVTSWSLGDVVAKFGPFIKIREFVRDRPDEGQIYYARKAAIEGLSRFNAIDGRAWLMFSDGTSIEVSYELTMPLIA